MIGTKTDTKQRIQLARVDSVDRQNDIETVRELMFDGGINITSERIERVLRPTSLVPTRVRGCYFVVPGPTNHMFPVERLFGTTI
jgi:hypothetical protein